MSSLKPARGTPLNLTHPHARGLVADYPINIGGGQAVCDYSPNKKTGIITGDIWAPGPNGWALNCNDVGYVNVPDLSLFADNTKGAISARARVTDNGNGTMPLVSFSRNADATITELTLFYKFDDDVIRAFLLINGVFQWDLHTDTNFLDDFAGDFLDVVLAHDGVTPTFIVNGVPVNTIFAVTTDKSKWLASIITNQGGVSPADTLSFGALFRNGSPIRIFNETIDRVSIYNVPLSAPMAASLHLDPYARFRQPSPARFFFIPTVAPVTSDPYTPNCTITATDEMIGAINPTGVISGTIEAVDTMIGEISG